MGCLLAITHQAAPRKSPAAWEGHMVPGCYKPINCVVHVARKELESEILKNPLYSQIENMKYL